MSKVPAVALSLLLFASTASAQELKWPSPGEHVSVQLQDQRGFSGVVTSETTSRSLSLAKTARGLTLESEFPRDKIKSIQVLPPLELPLDAPPLPAVEDEPPPPPAKLRRPISSPRVASLSVRAQLANWDSDPGPDGLLVRVSPLDAGGAFLPAAGNIDLELYGQRHQQPSHVFDDREAFPLLDRAAKLVRSSDAGAEGYLVRLPFRRFHPDRNLEFSNFALVRARFSVPGQGAFEASDDWTVIRPSSRFRDDVQQLTGNRYLPREQTRLQKPFDIRQVSP